MALGCAAAFFALTVVMITIGVVLSFSYSSSAKVKPPEFVTQADTQADSIRQALHREQEKAKREKEKVDLDATIRTLYGIEKAMAEANSFKDLTPYVVESEREGVAPDVKALKLRFFDLYKNFLDTRDSSREMESVYTVTKKAIEDLFSFVGVDVIQGVTFNRQQAERVWKKRLEDQKLRGQIKKRLLAHEGEMIDFLMDYARISEKYLKNWEALCATRDRAYLALNDRNWSAAIKNASEAIALSPNEREAHIILALALLERGEETDRPLAEATIKKLLAKHKTLASAYLLRGVMNFREGARDQAALDFEQAAAYYPKQEADVTNLLNLYKKRAYLNKSKEGRVILNAYRSIMSGAGFFSPDFQMARLLLNENDKTASRRKVFDHFYRRRRQHQWGHVLSDFKFCEDNLKTGLYEIFANDHVALKIEDAPVINAMFFSNTLNVTVYNNSKRDLRNVSLLLCVRFTDMFKGDYVTFTVGESIATLKTGQKVKLERKDITELTKQELGEAKQFEDIVEYGAVLISDEVITWVPPVGAVFSGSPQGGKSKPENPLNQEYLTTTAKKVIRHLIDKTLEQATAPASTDANKKKSSAKAK